MLVAPRQQRRWSPIPARRLEFCHDSRAQGRMAKQQEGAEPNKGGLRRPAPTPPSAAPQSRQCNATGCTPDTTSIVQAGSFSSLPTICKQQATQPRSNQTERTCKQYVRPMFRRFFIDVNIYSTPTMEQGTCSLQSRTTKIDSD